MDIQVGRRSSLRSSAFQSLHGLAVRVQRLTRLRGTAVGRLGPDWSDSRSVWRGSGGSWGGRGGGKQRCERCSGARRSVARAACGLVSCLALSNLLHLMLSWVVFLCRAAPANLKSGNALASFNLIVFAGPRHRFKFRQTVPSAPRLPCALRAGGASSSASHLASWCVMRWQQPAWQPSHWIWRGQR